MGHGGSKLSESRIALLKLNYAKMKFKKEWFASISVGGQTFSTASSEQTDTPTWNSEERILLDRGGPHIARISVFESNNLAGYCEIDLFEYLTQDSNSALEEFDLLDPSSSDVVVGNISVSCSVEDPTETAKNFASQILSIVDYDGDGTLQISEFSDLINAFGNEVAVNQIEELFKAADANGDGVVSVDELAALIATQQYNEPLINDCPVCGDTLEVSHNVDNMVHLTLCLDQGTGKENMAGGLPPAAYGWVFKISEWDQFPSSPDIGWSSRQNIGLTSEQNMGLMSQQNMGLMSVQNIGLTSALNIGLTSEKNIRLPRKQNITHILVYDRKNKKLVDEIIDWKLLVGMKVLYQSWAGWSLKTGAMKSSLQLMSEIEGRKMDSVESAAKIPEFIKSFKDQINVDEAKYPPEHFKTFNEFFIRELKTGARPIADKDRDEVAVCAADCRLTAFRTVEDSLRFWIKGRKFSFRGLLGNEVSSDAFNGGSLVIFRLAPQDYHRFHSPVAGTIEKFIEIPGCLYSVNPIAVSSPYCSVLTENKRVVTIISTKDFGKLAFVAIGATLVGSITFSKKEGDHLQKGDELGYFSFGGSTVVCVFEKDAIEINADLLENSEKSLETLVQVGMTLGDAIKKKD